jgi:DNA-binding NarL/FixJ family response regulator
LVLAAIALSPDVIVSDLEMPLLSGVAAMKELHAAGHLVPFVLLTAGADHARGWLQMGVLAVVDKSDLYVDLIPAVRSAAEGRSYLSRKAALGGPSH